MDRMLEQPVVTKTIVSFLLDRTGWMARAPGSNVIGIPLRCALSARNSTTSEDANPRAGEGVRDSSGGAFFRQPTLSS
jgi:hypothetical protein